MTGADRGGRRGGGKIGDGSGVKKGWGGARGGCVAMEGEGSEGGGRRGGRGQRRGGRRGSEGEERVACGQVGNECRRSEYVGVWNSRIAEEQ